MRTDHTHKAPSRRAAATAHTAKKARKHRLAFWGWLLSALLAMATLALILVMITQDSPVPRQHPGQIELPVTALQLSPSTQAMAIERYGTVRAGRRVMLSASASGNVARVHADWAVGRFIRKGTALLEIDRRQAALQVANATAQLASAEQDYILALAEHRVAKRDWGDAKGVSPLALKIPYLKKAEAHKKAAEVALAQAELAYNDRILKAPFDGILAEIHTQPGQYLEFGDSVAALVAVDHALVELVVANDDLRYLELPYLRDNTRPAAPISAMIEVILGDEALRWPGYVDAVAPERSADAGGVRIMVRVDNPYGLALPENPSAQRGGDRQAQQRPDEQRDEQPDEQRDKRIALQPGMRVLVRLYGEMRENVFRVPSEAIQRQGQVAVIDAARQVHMQDVNILKLNDDWAFIEGDGLEAGTLIAKDPIAIFSENMKVRITSTWMTDGGDGGGGS
jgi:multidrug efflux pump subunit AcrA (membrane-fusion protein)